MMDGLEEVFVELGRNRFVGRRNNGVVGWGRINLLGQRSSSRDVQRIDPRW
jgi:hypothetical protein